MVNFNFTLILTLTESEWNWDKIALKGKYKLGPCQVGATMTKYANIFSYFMSHSASIPIDHN